MIDKTFLPDGVGTFIMAVATILSMALLQFGFDVPIESIDQFIVAGMMIWMRFRTSTPPGGSVDSKLNILGVGK